MKKRNENHKNTEFMMKNNVYESINWYFYYKLAPLTRDVICTKLYRDGENILVSICQANTLFNNKDSNRLRIHTGKRHPQIKPQCLQKLWIWAFGSCVHQIKKNEVASGKTPFFVIGPFCIHRSICFNIGLWSGSSVWKWCVFNFGTFN